MTIYIKRYKRVHTGTQTHGKSWIKRTHSSWWKTQLWLIWWRSTRMLRENLRWEIPFQICPHSCTKTPFKACSTTLVWIYGAATFYPKCSDFSTKSLSPSSQRPPARPLSPSGNNSSDRKKGKCLVQLFQFWFQVFRFLYCEPPCTHPIWIDASLGLWRLAACQIRLFTGNRLFYTCRGFRSTREIFRAFYEAFIDLCKIRAFVSVWYRGRWLDDDA